MDRFITDLMDRMTLREKLGQLNLPSGGDLVTGSVMNGELSDMIRKQEIGGFFNVKGIQKINVLQHLAVEESRLKIPLLVGADVIHGYETIFPIPLALSCSWDTLAVERMARISAIEASADGINWTFSPMVDICRDARWGRIAEGSGEDPDGFRGKRLFPPGCQAHSFPGRLCHPGLPSAGRRFPGLAQSGTYGQPHQAGGQRVGPVLQRGAGGPHRLRKEQEPGALRLF